MASLGFKKSQRKPRNVGGQTRGDLILLIIYCYLRLVRLKTILNLKICLDTNDELKLNVKMLIYNT